MFDIKIDGHIDRYVEAVSGVGLFSRLSRGELKRILRSSKGRISKYGKDEIIHLQNEMCRTLDVILDGRVSVQHIDENGNMLTITSFSQKETLGANLLFSSKNSYPMTVVAASESVVLHLPKEDILRLCEDNPGFMVDLITVISDTTLVLTDKISAISLKSVRESIIAFLRHEYHLQKSNVIRLRFSKKDLAERLGIQRTSLSRELNKMRRDGLVEYDARSITVKDPEVILQH